MLAIKKASAEFVGYNDIETAFQNILNAALHDVTTGNFKDFQFDITDDSLIASIFYGDDVTTGDPIQARVLQYDVRGYNEELAVHITRQLNQEFNTLGLEPATIDYFHMKISEKTLIVVILHH
jgi:hypothetical protein